MQDTSSIIDTLPPIPTTRTLHIPEPFQFFNTLATVQTEYQLPQKQLKNSYPTLSKITPIPSTSQTPIKTIPEHTTNSPSDISSFTFSQFYPKLERLKSSTTSSSTDLYHKDKDSESTASTRVPRHSYNL